ncbi:TPA: helicase [bacterium]|nr:helicase [bacterium]
MGNNEVYLDLETQDIIGEKELRISVACIFKNGYKVFMENEIESLLDELFSSSLVIGFNLFDFDYKVLGAYTEKDLYKFPTIDMLREIKKVLGFRISLNNLAKANLDKQKLGSGLDAVRFWKEGNIEKLIEYCIRDVEVTKDIYQLGKKQGFLYYIERGSNGEKKKVSVKW